MSELPSGSAARGPVVQLEARASGSGVFVEVYDPKDESLSRLLTAAEARTLSAQLHRIAEELAGPRGRKGAKGD